MCPDKFFCLREISGEKSVLVLCVDTGPGSSPLRMTCPFLISGSNKKNELGSRALLTKAGTLAKKKSKLTSCTSQQPNPLDQTCIHPESYNIAMR